MTYKSWKYNNSLREYSKAQKDQKNINADLKNEFKRIRGIEFGYKSVLHHLLDKEDPNYNDINEVILIDDGSKSDYIHKIIHLCKQANLSSSDLINYLTKVPCYYVDNSGFNPEVKQISALDVIDKGNKFGSFDPTLPADDDNE